MRRLTSLRSGAPAGSASDRRVDIPSRLACLQGTSVLLLLLLLALGCGEARTSVRGKVTSNGQPLQYGHIFFEPTDGGRGLDGGADVFDGEYAIRSISPGPKRVRIKSKPSPKRVPGGVNDREHVEMVPPADPIPAQAEGNNREVVIVRGDQELDFDVTYSPKKK